MMIALDTNILARLVTNDDPVQAQQAATLIDSGKSLYVPLTVMLELEWVLRGAYSLPKSDIVNSLEGLLSVRNITFEKQADVQQALQYYQAGFDFADSLHHGGAAGCSAFATFDKEFVRRGSKSGLMPPVVAPPVAMATKPLGRV